MVETEEIAEKDLSKEKDLEDKTVGEKPKHQTVVDTEEIAETDMSIKREISRRQNKDQTLVETEEIVKRVIRKIWKTKQI